MSHFFNSRRRVTVSVGGILGLAFLAIAIGLLGNKVDIWGGLFLNLAADALGVAGAVTLIDYFTQKDEEDEMSKSARLNKKYLGGTVSGLTLALAFLFGFSKVMGSDFSELDKKAAKYLADLDFDGHPMDEGYIKSFVRILGNPEDRLGKTIFLYGFVLPQYLKADILELRDKVEAAYEILQLQLEKKTFPTELMARNLAKDVYAKNLDVISKMQEAGE